MRANGGIVVTGAGCLSALGAGLDTSVAAMFAGHVQDPSVAAVPSTLPEPPCVFGVQQSLLFEEDVQWTRTTRLGMTAAAAAISEAWGDHVEVEPARFGVCMGTTVGNTFNGEPFYKCWIDAENPDSATIRRYLGNDLGRSIADFLGAAGPALTIANACASGTDAIGLGAMWLECNLCDVVVAGGADELNRLPYLGFGSLKNCSLERCRPFDRDRQGLNLGEGAGVVVLEREVDARRRGATVLAKIAGYASATDAHHMTAPHPDGRGLRQALAEALSRAGVAPGDIGMVNAHGTATLENDRIEGRVLAELFGDDTPVLSTKGYTGHTLGAAGALEAILSIGCLIEEKAPVNAGFSTPDPECVLIPATSITPIKRPWAVSTSLAFGGTNSVIVISREGLS